MSKTKCPRCGSLTIRPGATKCPSCRAWVSAPKLAGSRVQIGALGLVLLAAGLGGVGMLAGGAAVLASQGRLGGKRPPATTPPPALPASSATSPQAASTSAASSALSSAAPAADTPPPASEAPAAFAVATTIRLDAPPIDVIVADDEAMFFVLCEDGTLRAHALDSGAEKARARLPGKGTGLRRLPAGRLAVLGVSTGLPVVNTASWLSGAAPAAYLKRVDVKGALDIAASGEPPVVVVATSQGSRVIRLAGPDLTADGEIFFPTPIRGVAPLLSSAGDRLLVLLDGRAPTEPGSVIVLDPAAKPFGGARAAWSSLLEPRASAVPPSASSERALLFDRATAKVMGFSVGTEPRLAPAGPQPIAAFPWPGDRAVVIGAAGEATLVSLEHREVLATVALGGVPSAAVLSPEGRTILVALGGGPRGKGATTVALGGEPLRIVSTLQTGEGSHVVSVAPKGRLALVAAASARGVTVLRRP
ncbi:zinc ribbon domain-containing protein [Polyangium sp. 15x6]|uniref:zinc ribbon domain-containing protein n=1 Tax=Polyangium sp. 15x6 TaxID=3042687 RepID=UPI00249A2942|nr:zinc ribbon domain-containing protein [Polyangium sp. 15x6]MDI3285758.1 zinc ribbon domain-containing protein [Polyangium sp. 15x6]